ncbi:S9 family peptidase [bacterium]|nr:S9 family peptidase [bacterium]
MKKTLMIILLLFLPATVFAQGKRNLTVDDLFAFKDVNDPQTSPDGKWIAYVVETMNAEKDKANKDIYMVPVAGGEAVQLTTHEEEDSHPRWSPDNKYLAFFSKRNKKKQVFLLNRSGGEAMQLTEVKQGVSDFTWSPDSKRLALVINDADPDAPLDDDKEKEKEKTKKPVVITRLQFKFDEYGYLKELYDHIYTLDVQSKQLKQITSGPYNDGGEVWSSASSSPQWSPDSKQIAFVSNRSEHPDANRNTDIFLVSAEGGEVKRLTTNEGPDEAPQWSPDGKWIVYQAQHQPDLIWYDTTEVMVIPARGGAPKVLTRELDRNCFMPRFSGDGRTIFFILEHEGKQLLASVSATGTGLNKNVGGENVVYDYDFGPNQSVILLASRTTLPAEIFHSTGGKSKQLTFTNTKVVEGIQLGTTERVRYKSKDGTSVEAFVVKPASFDASKKYPLVLWPHGGPTSQYMEDFDFRAQLFAASGYVVLLVNPRGSTGYGEEFCKAIFADWGNKDYEDEMAGVDHLISLGYADGEKMAVGGWSYGGMMTDFIITKTTRFKAAMSGASEANYFMDYGVDHYQYEWEKEIGLPWERPELYMKLSPFFDIEKVKTPTLVMCGESDQNVPLINSEQIFQALKRLGIDTMLVVYPGEPHGINTPSYQKDRFQRYMAWFDYYLKGAPSKVPAK